MRVGRKGLKRIKCLIGTSDGTTSEMPNAVLVLDAGFFTLIFCSRPLVVAA